LKIAVSARGVTAICRAKFARSPGRFDVYWLVAGGAAPACALTNFGVPTMEHRSCTLCPGVVAGLKMLDCNGRLLPPEACQAAG